jgi:hypothetical protein
MAIPKQISNNLMDEEEILYDQPPYMVGLQMSTKARMEDVRGAVFTNKRIIFYRHTGFFGLNLKDFSWQDIRNVNKEEGLISGEMEFEMVGGLDSEILYMPKGAVQKMYLIVRELVAKAHESLQQSHVIVQQVSQEDSMAKLKQLKEMLDSGLISQSEYDSKKTDILSRM